jgi:hypothetical protein
VLVDVNDDGRLDLAVACFSPENAISVLLDMTPAAAATPAFAAEVSYTVGSRPASVASGDFNADGHPDLVVANGGASSVSVLLGR